MGKQSFKTGEFAFILLPTTDWHLPRAFAGASKVALMVKNMPANAGDRRDTDSTPGSGRFPWRRARQPTPGFSPGEPHRQEPGGLQPTRSQRVGHD